MYSRVPFGRGTLNAEPTKLAGTDTFCRNCGSKATVYKIIISSNDTSKMDEREISVLGLGLSLRKVDPDPGQFVVILFSTMTEMVKFFDPYLSVLSMASTPFHVICTPMQNSTKAITRRIPWAVCGETRAVIFGA